MTGFSLIGVSASSVVSGEWGKYLTAHAAGVVGFEGEHREGWSADDLLEASVSPHWGRRCVRPLRSSEEFSSVSMTCLPVAWKELVSWFGKQPTWMGHTPRAHHRPSPPQTPHTAHRPALSQHPGVCSRWRQWGGRGRAPSAGNWLSGGRLQQDRMSDLGSRAARPGPGL